MLETGAAKPDSAESPRGPASDSSRPPVKVGGARSCGWKGIPNNYNLSFLVSLSPPRTGGQQPAQLRAYGEAVLHYVPKALSAEPQGLLAKPVGLLLCLLFVPKIRPMKTEHRPDT